MFSIIIDFTARILNKKSLGVKRYKCHPSRCTVCHLVKGSYLCVAQIDLKAMREYLKLRHDFKIKNPSRRLSGGGFLFYTRLRQVP